MKNIFKTLYTGISLGCIIFVLLDMIFFSIGGESAAFITDNFIAQAIGSMLVGIGFSVPSLIYDSKKLPLRIKVLVHMGTGLIIYFIIAFFLKWINIEHGIGSVVTNIAIATVCTFLIWLCFYLYNKKEAKLINDKIKEKQG